MRRSTSKENQIQFPHLGWETYQDKFFFKRITKWLNNQVTGAKHRSIAENRGINRNIKENRKPEQY
jgi:hypothetical protein